MKKLIFILTTLSICFAQIDKCPLCNEQDNFYELKVKDLYICLNCLYVDYPQQILDHPERQYYATYDMKLDYYCVADTLYLRSSSSSLISNISGNYIIDTPINTLTFSDIKTQPEFSISWDKGKIDIEYGKNTSPSKAVKVFFNFLKEYIESEYFLIDKTKYDELIKIDDRIISFIKKY